MKRIWVLVLLVSLGLNLGLGLRLLKDRGDAGEGSRFGRGAGQHREAPRWAARDSAARRRMFDRRLDRMAEHLGLDPEQRVVFDRVHAATGRLLMRKREIIAEKRTLLRDLVGRPEIDRAEVRAAITELGQQQAVLDSLVAETVLQELEVLTPDQRERYLAMLALDGSGGRGSRGRGGRGGHRQ